ncbi:MAG: hypothetical protein QOG43_242 [Actinomycetota bacterium]|nr:hypothetical protein [Actinomycetota bacterium]
MRIPAAIAQKAAGLVGREWALAQVAEWLGSGSERLFLLTGEPGAGKSVLAGWLAGAGPEPADEPVAAALDRVRGTWSAACFCMTRGQDGADITPAWFVTSLAKQLSARHPAFADAFLRVNAPELIHQEVTANEGTVIGHIGDLEVKLPDARDRYAQGVVEPLRAMAEAHADQIFAILVDGVDEAFVGPDPTVVSLLARSGSLPGNVRFLVTTRNERALVTQLQDGFGSDVRHLDLSSGDGAAGNEADVRLFVRARLATVDPAATETVVEQLVQQAAGNFLFIDFLLDEVGKGGRRLTDTAALPTGLFDLYRQYLQRIVPGFAERDRGPEWGEHYQPLLGSISVALPAAPADRLRGWLDWEDDDLSRFLQTVEQVTEWEPATGEGDDGGGGGGGGWRLYHRSLGDFLAARYVDDRGSDNRFYVAPPKQHDRIVRHYLRSLADLWGGDWANCDDGYCLRNLVRHMASSLVALERPADRAARTAELFDVVLDPGFRARQREAPGGPAAMYGDVRAAIEAGLPPPPPGGDDRLAGLVEVLAAAPEVERRGLAVEALVRLAAKDGEGSPGGRRATDVMLRLLASDSPDAWNVALKAAAATGALEVFQRAAVDKRDALRPLAGLYAYLRWRPDDPDCLPVRLLTELAGTVSISGQILRAEDRLVLDFLAGLSILIYVNHPDRADVVVQTSTLWYEVLKNRLKLHLLNRKALVKVATPLVAQVYATRLLETFLFSSPEEASRYFASDRTAVGRVVPLVDPAADLAGRTDDLATLLQSALAVTRMVGGMVVAIHSFHDPAGTDALVRDLFGRLDDAGRRWLLWAHAVLVEKAPGQWVGLLEDLTRTFVDDNRAAFLAADGGTGAPFEIDLLPLGLAYGKRGGPMTYFGTLLVGAASGAAADPGLLGRVIRGLAPVGFYHPQAVLQLLRDSVPQLLDPAVEDSVATTLATIRVLHPDTVDLFLRDVGAPDRLRELVASRGDVELVRRYIVWVGFYNNGVHQALFHPQMRVGLLSAILGALATAKDAKAFVRQITPGPLEMLRRADYHLERWTEA